MLDGLGRHAEALDHASRALELYRAAGHLAGQASALNAVGWAHAQLGEYEPALDHCRQALALLRRPATGTARRTPGTASASSTHRLGHHAQAVRCYQRALGLYRRIGDRYDEADTLARLGESRRRWATRPAPCVPGGGPWASSTTSATRTPSGCGTCWPGSPPVTLGTPAVVDRGAPAGVRPGTP